MEENTTRIKSFGYPQTQGSKAVKVAADETALMALCHCVIRAVFQNMNSIRFKFLLFLVFLTFAFPLKLPMNLLFDNFKQLNNISKIRNSILKRHLIHIININIVPV